MVIGLFHLFLPFLISSCSMLLRHTGTQLLCPACGVALGCLWAPSALLLGGTVSKQNRGFPFYVEALFARGEKTYKVSSEEKKNLEPY